MCVQHQQLIMEGSGIGLQLHGRCLFQYESQGPSDGLGVAEVNYRSTGAFNGSQANQ